MPRRQKTQSRYDEDNYALPDLPQGSSSDISSSQRSSNPATDSQKENKGKKIKWKRYCIVIACLSMGIGAGVAGTIMVLRDKDSTPGIDLGDRVNVGDGTF